MEDETANQLSTSPTFSEAFKSSNLEDELLEINKVLQDSQKARKDLIEKFVLKREDSETDQQKNRTLWRPEDEGDLSERKGQYQKNVVSVDLMSGVKAEEKENRPMTVEPQGDDNPVSHETEEEATIKKYFSFSSMKKDEEENEV